MGADQAEPAEDPRDIVLRASGRVTIADAIAWVAESRSRQGGVDDQTLMWALTELSGDHATVPALKAVSRVALRSEVDPSVELLQLHRARTPAELRRSLDRLASVSPTGDLRGVTAETVAMALTQDVLVVEALALVAGLSYRDLTDLALNRYNTPLPGRAESSWTQPQVTSAFAIIDQIVRGETGPPSLGDARNAEPIEWLLDESRPHGWEAVTAMLNEGVPYEVLLAQRAAGGSWIAHRNATSTAFGHAVGSLVFVALDEAGLTYRRRATTAADGHTAAELAELVGATSSSGHIAAVLPGTGEAKLVICQSVARDGGTARKNAGRLRELPHEVSVPAAAVVFGPGWASRTESLELVEAFEGRVFTECSLDRLVAWAASTIEGPNV